jgi:hypothetical protein
MVEDLDMANHILTSLSSPTLSTGKEKDLMRMGRVGLCP